jgi:predicted nucleic acid-binding protein
MAFVYFFERHATYRRLLRPLFESIDRGQVAAVSSYLTLLEVLVQPIRAGRFDLVRLYRDTLLRGRNFDLVPLDGAVAEQAAEIRALYGFRTPDSIQLATALRRRADLYVTNDRRLARFEGLTILVLDDLLPS